MKLLGNASQQLRLRMACNSLAMLTRVQRFKSCDERATVLQNLQNLLMRAAACVVRFLWLIIHCSDASNCRILQLSARDARREQPLRTCIAPAPSAPPAPASCALLPTRHWSHWPSEFRAVFESDGELFMSRIGIYALPTTVTRAHRNATQCHEKRRSHQIMYDTRETRCVRKEAAQIAPNPNMLAKLRALIAAAAATQSSSSSSSSALLKLALLFCSSALMFILPSCIL